MLRGNVVYHRLINKTEEEKEMLRNKIKEKIRRKEELK